MAFAVGVDLGDGNSLFNAGMISAHETGVKAGTSSVINMGTIGATDDGSGIGLRSNGAVTNLGFIYSQGVGVSLRDTGQTLANSGTIQGTVFAVDLGIDSTLMNTGTIDGIVDAFTGVSADQVVNSGAIIGDVLLKAGVDRYDGRQGSVSGLVDLGEGNDTAFGGLGDETFIAGLGNDVLNGGAGSDTVTLINGLANITVNLALTGQQVTGEGLDTLTAVENLVTGDGNDALTGNAAANRFDAGGGNDTLIGGLGNDTLIGGLLDDILDGGAGSDTAIFTGAAAATVNLTKTVAQNTGHGLDTLRGIEHLLGDAGNDSFMGSAAGNNLTGGAGNDLLNGFTGNDVLIGQIGNDVLIGGAGSDLLTGGTGADTFFFQTALAQAGIDKITDFVAADDTIRLKKSVFAALTVGTLSVGAFREGAAAGEADDRIIYNKTTGQLFYDADGTGTAAAQIHFATLVNKAVVTAADFLVV